MRLSEDIKKWRSERPDEWTMDRFYLEALRLEAVEEKLKADNSDYAAALEVYCEFHQQTGEDALVGFESWLRERLNASHIA